MAYGEYSVIVPQRIEETSTTQQLPINFKVSAVDPTYGGGEFLYLLGAASTVVGDVVSYSGVTGATSRWDGTANTGLPLAVAMSANVANQWGWYQTMGNAVVNLAGNVLTGGKVFYGGTTAQLDDTAVNGKQVIGAIFGATSTAATGVCTIAWPSVQTQTV